MKDVVFWDVTPCGSYKNRHFVDTYRLVIRMTRRALAADAVRSWLSPFTPATSACSCRELASHVCKRVTWPPTLATAAGCSAGLRFPAGLRDIYPLHIVQTGCGARCVIVKGVQARHVLPSSAETKKHGACM
jgi:hypothetical protein